MRVLRRRQAGLILIVLAALLLAVSIGQVNAETVVSSMTFPRAFTPNQYGNFSITVENTGTVAAGLFVYLTINTATIIQASGTAWQVPAGTLFRLAQGSGTQSPTTAPGSMWTTSAALQFSNAGNYTLELQCGHIGTTGMDVVDQTYYTYAIVLSTGTATPPLTTDWIIGTFLVVLIVVLCFYFSREEVKQVLKR